MLHIERGLCGCLWAFLDMAMRHELTDLALQIIFCSILHPLRLILS